MCDAKKAIKRKLGGAIIVPPLVGVELMNSRAMTTIPYHVIILPLRPFNSVAMICAVEKCYRRRDQHVGPNCVYPSCHCVVIWV